MTYSLYRPVHMGLVCAPSAVNAEQQKGPNECAQDEYVALGVSLME